MVQNFMTIGVFYVSANNLHDLSIPVFLKMSAKKCCHGINIQMGSWSKGISQNELHQTSSFLIIDIIL